MVDIDPNIDINIITINVDFDVAKQKIAAAKPNSIVMLTRDEFQAFREGKLEIPPGIHVSSDQQTLKDFA